MTTNEKTGTTCKIKPNSVQTQGAGIQFKTQSPIVGTGSSAGGLEAFETFFPALPEDTAIPFDPVTHLDPSHATILADLIQKKTKVSFLNGKLQLLKARSTTCADTIKV